MGYRAWVRGMDDINSENRRSAGWFFYVALYKYDSTQVLSNFLLTISHHFQFRNVG